VRVFFYILVLIFLGCSKVSLPGYHFKNKNVKIAVLPYKNYSDTYLAGYRVASILSSVLRAKGYNVINSVVLKSENPKTDINELINKYKNKADYIVFGSVNEFKYKTGIDAQPAVSITTNIYDTKKNKIIYSFSSSNSSWSFDSITTVTQKILEESFK
jgi:TolB-like protein